MTTNEALKKISEGLQAEMTRYMDWYEEARKRCFDALTDRFVEDWEVQSCVNDMIRFDTARQITHHAYCKVKSFMGDDEEAF